MVTMALIKGDSMKYREYRDKVSKLRYKANFKAMPARLEPIDTIDYRCPVCGTLHVDLDYMALIRQAESNKDYIRLPCGHIVIKIGG